MKSLFLMGAVFFGVLVSMNVNAIGSGYNQGGCAPACDTACPADQQCDASTGDCWCRYVHYEPCYYSTPRCVEEKIPCKKLCTRYVPKYYQVQRCKYVPQYYTETFCKQECETYEVDDCKTCTKTVYDQHCRYVPKYYWKHVCGDNTCNAPCPQQSACPN